MIFAVPLWEKFGRFLIVAVGFLNMLIDSVLQERNQDFAKGGGFKIKNFCYVILMT